MSYASKAGSFTSNTAAGNQSITGLGFQPKVVLFYLMGDDGTTNDYRMGFGAYDGTSQFAQAATEKTNVLTSAASTIFETASCGVMLTPGATTVDMQFAGVSLDADGFTINLTTAPATGRKVHFVAIGGNSVSVKVGNSTLPTTATTLAVTGCGFMPNALIFAYGKDTAGSGAETGARFGFGLATAAANAYQWASYGVSDNAQAGGKTERISSAVDSLLGVTTANTYTFRAQLSSLDTDGFTLNQSTTDGLTRPFGYVAIKAPKARVWWGDTNTATGTETWATDASGKAFYPDTLLVASGANSDTSPSGTFPTSGVHNIIDIGAATATLSEDATQQFMLSAVSFNGQNPTEAGAKDYPHYFGSGYPGSATTWADEMVADLTARSTTGFTLNWTTVSTARTMGYLALGDGAQTLDPTGIPSDEIFGATTVKPGAATVSPSGVASAEAFGTAAITTAYTVKTAGIATSEAFGALTVTTSISVDPTGIASGEAFGQPSIAASVTPSGIASGEAFGTATMQPGPVTLDPVGIASTEVFGQAAIEALATVNPTGIASVESFGSPTLTQTEPAQVVSPSGIVTSEAFGTLTVTPGATAIKPAGIASGEGFYGVKVTGGEQAKPVAGYPKHKPRTYRYKGHEYASLQHLRKALQLEGVQDEPEHPRIKRKRKGHTRTTPVLDAYLERYRAVPGAINKPHDDVERLFNEIVVLNADIRRAQNRLANGYDREIEARLKAERDLEIASYLRIVHESHVRADDEQAIMLILAALKPEFLPVLGQ